MPKERKIAILTACIYKFINVSRKIIIFLLQKRLIYRKYTAYQDKRVNQAVIYN